MIFFKNNKEINFKKLLKRLDVQVVLALILAIFIGILLPKFILGFYFITGAKISNFIPSISWIGDIFMNLLKMFLVPLLFFSVLSAVLGLGDMKKLGVLGLRTFYYYMLTTAIAIMISLFLMNIFLPGKGLNLGLSEGFNVGDIESSLGFGTFITSLIPGNIIISFVEFNAIQIVISSMILGISILALNTEGTKVFLNIVDTINNAILKFIAFVIKFTPIGVFAIVSNVIYENGLSSVMGLLPFVYIVLFALFIHSVIFLPLLGFIIGKFNPWVFFNQIKEAILVGFSTSSSSATLGVTMNVAKNNAKISEEVVSFSFPLGATVNMNGTALYQAGVTLFIAQVLGIDLSIGAQLTMVLIVILASVGAAGVPGAGIIILTTIFMTIGLPVEAIGIILAVDRILDMFRTAVNIWGDLITAKIVDRYYKYEVLSKYERWKKYSKDDLDPNIVTN